MHSGSVYTPLSTQPRKKMSKSREMTPALFPGVCTADHTVTRPRLLRKQRSGNKRTNMADEDVEMDNFSEERAESASDFAGDDENDKVV